MDIAEKVKGKIKKTKEGGWVLPDCKLIKIHGEIKYIIHIDRSNKEISFYDWQTGKQVFPPLEEEKQILGAMGYGFGFAWEPQEAN